MIKIFKSYREYTDSGFGTIVENQPDRLVNHDGSLNVVKTGLGFFEHLSFFHELIRMSWWKFNLIVIFSYVTINIFFGLIFWWIGMDGIDIPHTGKFIEDFMHAFYFSAQTFSTVGYGRINPLNHFANMVAVVEMLVGMMYLALAAGLLYGRFSRPVSKIIFSENAIIAPYKGGKGLMFRMANAKNNLIVDVGVQVLLTMIVDDKGKRSRKFFQLDLERTKINMLALTWTVVHPVDENSPLRNFTEKDLLQADAEILILVNGMNDTFSQVIHARTSYKSEDIVWGVKFASAYQGRKKKTVVNMNLISSFVKMED